MTSWTAASVLRGCSDGLGVIIMSSVECPFSTPICSKLHHFINGVSMGSEDAWFWCQLFYFRVSKIF